jgi:hypothetical protein
MSMSPIRGDVKKNSSPSSPRGDCIQPNLSSGEAVGTPHLPDRPSSWRFELDGFMDRDSRAHDLQDNSTTQTEFHSGRRFEAAFRRQRLPRPVGHGLAPHLHGPSLCVPTNASSVGEARPGLASFLPRHVGTVNELFHDKANVQRRVAGLFLKWSFRRKARQGLHRSKPEGFGVELSNLYITKEDLVEVFCNKFKAEILKA